MALTVRDVRRTFGDFVALGGVSLDVQDGEVLALLGPSGSGKTTLLRVIAGLEAPDAGRILFDDEDVTDLDIRKRRVGFVFQHYALFRHMSVFENVAFGLKVARNRPSAADLAERVHRLLELVQLSGLEKRLPSQISGGQRQRVALARALAIDPRVLLLDEPFGALDAQVRKELRRWLRKLHDELHVTSVFVTHDQEEALEVADRVVVLNQGRIEQIASPVEVYDKPASRFVLEFIGDINRVPCRIDSGWLHIGPMRFPAEGAAGLSGDVEAYVRPSAFDLKPPGSPNTLPAVITHIAAVGPIVRLGLTSGSLNLEAELSRDRVDTQGLRVGQTISVHPRSIRIFHDGRQYNVDLPRRSRRQYPHPA